MRLHCIYIYICLVTNVSIQILFSVCFFLVCVLLSHCLYPPQRHFPTPLVLASVLTTAPVCGLSVSTTTMVPKLGWMKQVIKPFTFYCWGLVPTPFTESLWSVWWGGFSLAQQISLDYSSGGFCKKERKKFAAVGKWGHFSSSFFCWSYCWRLLCWTLGNKNCRNEMFGVCSCRVSPEILCSWSAFLVTPSRSGMRCQRTQCQPALLAS